MKVPVDKTEISSRLEDLRRGALKLLRERGAVSVNHLNGTLFEHLVRTESLLRAWGSHDVLATAGLCHAVYGTDGFTPHLLDLDERDALVSAIGPDAESIVYFYASCDRGFVYSQITAGEAIIFRDRFTGKVFSPAKEELRAFADLTLANEVDVVTGGAEVTSVPEWFVTLAQGFGVLASAEVARACELLISSAP